ncbi:MAG: PhnD/SsuA/transferrin family substrate-binding protein [Cyanobacteriota bacterium]|jgi:ABC-type amino acid transport substrate-binding protein
MKNHFTLLHFSLAISTSLGGCSLAPFQTKAALCPSGETLRIGVDQQLFPLNQGLDEQASDIKKLETFLGKVTQCPIQMEPIVSAQLGRKSIKTGSFDFAFLAPSLSVLALNQDSGYVPLRSLGQNVLVRSAMLVPETSNMKDYSGLNGKKIGLLSSGLIGYYLARYNTYGVNIAGTDYGLSYEDLVNKLKNHQVDAIAWDTQITPLPPGTRLGAIDPHLLPSGALLMHSRLNSLDYTGLLKELDENSFQLPSFLRYGASTKPELTAYNHFIKIVQTVDQWDKQSQPIIGQQEATH